MYKCYLSKTIWADPEKSDIHEVLIKDITLLFPPFKGLEIHEGKFRSGELISVIWRSDKEIVIARSKDEFPWEDEDFHTHTPEEITNFWVKRMGWEIPIDD